VSAFVVNIKGKSSHPIVQQALQGVGATSSIGRVRFRANTGDGAGILMQAPRVAGTGLPREMKTPCPARANTASAWSFSPPHPRNGYKCEVLLKICRPRKAAHARLAPPCPPNTVRSAKPPSVEAIVARCSIARPDGRPTISHSERSLRHPKLASGAIRTAGLSGGEKILRLQPVRQNDDLQGHG